jgi:hypothetical protein
MAPEERATLETLDKILRSPEVRAQIKPIVERVHADLGQKDDVVIQSSPKVTPKGFTSRQARLMTWEPIPLVTFGDTLPHGIHSSWVFVLREGADTGAERHPNSHQRMMSWEGTGDMRVEDEEQRSEVRDQTSNVAIQWQSNLLVSDANASLERRWISIPQNVWHRPVVPKGADWVVVSFHTVPAEELIEERRDDDGVSGTKRMRYLD